MGNVVTSQFMDLFRYYSMLRISIVYRLIVLSKYWHWLTHIFLVYGTTYIVMVRQGVVPYTNVSVIFWIRVWVHSTPEVGLQSRGHSAYKADDTCWTVAETELASRLIHPSRASNTHKNTKGIALEWQRNKVLLTVFDIVQTKISTTENSKRLFGNVIIKQI